MFSRKISHVSMSRRFASPMYSYCVSILTVFQHMLHLIIAPNISHRPRCIFLDGVGNRIMSQVGIHSSRYKARCRCRDRGYFHFLLIKHFRNRTLLTYSFSFSRTSYLPQNFLFDPEGHIRLSDFGLAYVFSSLQHFTGAAVPVNLLASAHAMHCLPGPICTGLMIPPVSKAGSSCSTPE